MIEVIEHEGIRFAEIIRVGIELDHTQFFSPADSSFQFGILAHRAGFIEPAHFHKHATRPIEDLQQMFVVQKGVVAVDFFDKMGKRFREIILKQGDSVLLVHGAHSIRVLEDMQCVSVKQGPFLGVENDKVNIETKS
jgi:hypothetical protein